MVKTIRGFIKKECTDDGRESVSKWTERETCQRPQAKTIAKDVSISPYPA